MKDGSDIARIAALIGDPARANILTALMSGKALTAGELAREAGVSLPTASGHLNKLEAGGLLAMRKQGRHKYFALASAEVAAVLEALMGLAAGGGHLRSRTGPRDTDLRAARVCYNHLAGDRGIQMYESLLARGLLREVGEAPELTAEGRMFVESLGVDVAGLETARAPMCRACIDWPERRMHLAGSLGRALLSHMEVEGWARRVEGSRVVRFSAAGAGAFDAAFPRVG